MPVLANQRHEIFAQEIAKGETATKAYETAGYKPSRKNASRLRAKEDVNVRVLELQGAAARSAKITIESICAELDAANAVARERGQAAAMVSASALRAKLAGLMVEKVEVGGPGDFDDCESIADVADRMLAGPGGPIEGFRPVDEQDRQGLIALLQCHADEMHEYIAAIKARPVVAERVDPADLTTPWRDLRPHSAPLKLSARGNGSRR